SRRTSNLFGNKPKRTPRTNKRLLKG
ncbi:hypothetical protein JL09_g6811, partial [Pichia kudriavzevii]